MSFIHSVVTATPRYRYSTQKIVEKASSWLNDFPAERALFERLAHSTTIDHRNFALPIEELLSLSGSAERAQIFQESGGELLREVLNQGMLASNLATQDVGALVTTSCSVPSIPALDARVINQLGLPETLLRVPVYQYGCAGGAIGISLASHLCVRLGVVLMASVELCSLVYQGGDRQTGDIVGSALFGDGAACVVISPEKGDLKISDSQSYLIPESHGLMGYDIFDDGAHLRLDRDIPQALLASAPNAIDTFLRRSGLVRSDISWWLFHPGGPKILTSLERQLSIERSQTRWSWESLQEHGNMSSASILFALKRFLEDRSFKPDDKVLMLGVGPGLTLQMNLLECC